VQVRRGKIRKAKSQDETWLGRNKKGNETGPEKEEESEREGCAAAQPGGKAYRCHIEKNKLLNAFLFQTLLKEILHILTSVKLLMFIQDDLGKAVVKEYTLFTVTK